MQEVRPVLQEGFPPQATGESEGVSRPRALAFRSQDKLTGSPLPAT